MIIYVNIDTTVKFVYCWCPLSPGYQEDTGFVYIGKLTVPYICTVHIYTVCMISYNMLIPVNKSNFCNLNLPVFLLFKVMCIG